jgi:hypothetical protein
LRSTYGSCRDQATPDYRRRDFSLSDEPIADVIPYLPVRFLRRIERNMPLIPRSVFVYIRPMNRPLPLIAGVLGVLFLAVAATYWFVPASDLPLFFPGFKAGSAHVAVKHAIGSLVIALVLFAFAWLQSRRKAPGALI